MTDPAVRVVLAGALAASFPRKAFEGQIDLVIAHTDDDLRSAVRDAVVLYSWQIPNIVPAETPQLRWIQLPSAGADHVRELPVWTSDIIITASQGIHTVPMSEHVFAMLLALNRHLPAILRAQEQHEWIHNRRGAPLRMGELRGKTMGIVGWGKSGTALHTWRGPLACEWWARDGQSSCRARRRVQTVGPIPIHPGWKRKMLPRHSVSVRPVT
jgi:phosphoglycerate dehydrogenase-like enzyme